MHLCVCELQQPPLHTLPAQQLSPKAPQLVVPLLLPDVELLQEVCGVPETDAVCPMDVHVIVQLEPLPPTEHDAPLADSLPQIQMFCPFVFALQHAALPVELLQEFDGVPEMDPVCPWYVQVTVQLEPLPPIEHEAPLYDSVPQMQ
jgi:hypothetical protein